MAGGGPCADDRGDPLPRDAVMTRAPLVLLLLALLPQPVLSAQTPAQDKLCILCHAQAGATAKDAGAHARLSCVECHAALKEYDAASGDEHATPLPKVDCSGCHAQAAQTWRASVHGQALSKLGLVISATCVTCHGAHGVRAAGAEDSPTARRQIPNTCGKCHAGILDTYLQGVHGAQFKAGSKDVPVCTD